MMSGKERVGQERGYRGDTAEQGPCPVRMHFPVGPPIVNASRSARDASEALTDTNPDGTDERKRSKTERTFFPAEFRSVGPSSVMYAHFLERDLHWYHVSNDLWAAAASRRIYC